MKALKIIGIMIGAVTVTALGIDAADTLNGSSGTLLSQVIDSGGACPAGMAVVENVPGVTCVDMYEASVGETCPEISPGNMFASVTNLESSDCEAVSVEGAMPWRFVSREQAFQLCARSGKRLPTNAEWYQLGLGMADVEQSCNVSSQKLSETGAHAGCVTPSGAYDLVGNVWEWVSDDVIEGTYNGRTVPESGFVTQVDNTGVATVSSTSTPSDSHGEDYFWSKTDGAYGMIRGGFYASDADAGLYAVHADTLPSTAGTAIGFRCVR